MKKILLSIVLSLMISQNNFTQTLDQQLRQAQDNGQISSQEVSKLTNESKSSLAALNSAQFFKDAPDGISSLFITPEVIETVRIGKITIYYPRGYGSNVLHYGIWNAIPFVVFDNDTSELRMGLIFEHRQVGFVPDSWVSTSITGKNLPEISFLIPASKTFLSFTHGSSQWRSTVLLTEEQISNLALYANNQNTDPDANIFTVNHRFVDSSTRPYLIGLRHKDFFKIMLQIYSHIGKLPQVKKFRSSDALPAGVFFEELTVDNVTTETLEIEKTEVEVPATPEPTENTDEEPGYYYDVSTTYEDDEYPDDGYADDEYADDEYNEEATDESGNEE